MSRPSCTKSAVYLTAISCLPRPVFAPYDGIGRVHYTLRWVVDSTSHHQPRALADETIRIYAPQNVDPVSAISPRVLSRLIESSLFTCAD